MANLSEGEVSDHDDVYMISSEEQSNYTNTSVIIIGRNKDEDSSSQTSGFSINYAQSSGHGTLDQYLKKKVINSSSSHRRKKNTNFHMSNK